MWIDIKLDIGWWGWQPYLKNFETTINGFNSLNIGSSVQLPPVNIVNLTTYIKPTNTPLFPPISPGTIVQWIGPIPLVFTPELSLDLKTDGSYGLTSSVNALVNSPLQPFGFALGSPDSPLQYGFRCGYGNTSYFSCSEINNLNQKFAEAQQHSSSWSPGSQPISGSLIGTVKLDANYKIGLSFAGKIKLWGTLGVQADIQPYVKAAANITVTKIATP
jgi:hypothetical protein